MGPSPAQGQGEYKVGKPYQVGGVWYVPREQPDYNETGVASWYGQAFNMKATSNGEVFDMNAFSAAHTTLPLPSMVEVTNLDNGKMLVVRVNDRGPFVGGRLIDLSYAAAKELGYAERGTARVRVRYVGPAPLGAPNAGFQVARATPAKPPVAAAALRTPDEDVILTSYKSPEPVGVTSLASLAPAAAPATKPAPTTRPAAPLTGAELGPPRAAPPAVAAIAAGFRVQAGAFSDEANARKAAAQLAGAGVAQIEPVERNGVTLYRVYLPAPGDEVAAYAVRDRVAAIGFADARVVQAY